MASTRVDRISSSEEEVTGSCDGGAPKVFILRNTAGERIDLSFRIYHFFNMPVLSGESRPDAVWRDFNLPPYARLQRLPKAQMKAIIVNIVFFFWGCLCLMEIHSFEVESSQTCCIVAIIACVRPS